VGGQLALAVRGQHDHVLAPRSDQPAQQQQRYDHDSEPGRQGHIVDQGRRLVRRMGSAERQDERDPDQARQHQRHQQPLHCRDQPPPPGHLVAPGQALRDGGAEGRLSLVRPRPRGRQHGSRPRLGQRTADLAGKHRDRVVDVGSLRLRDISGITG